MIHTVMKERESGVLQQGGRRLYSWESGEGEMIPDQGEPGVDFGALGRKKEVKSARNSLSPSSTPSRFSQLHLASRVRPGERG